MMSENCSLFEVSKNVVSAACAKILSQVANEECNLNREIEERGRVFFDKNLPSWLEKTLTCLFSDDSETMEDAFDRVYINNRRQKAMKLIRGCHLAAGDNVFLSSDDVDFISDFCGVSHER